MKKNLESQYRTYLKSTATELNHVYGRYSSAKESAMNYCKNRMNELNGYGMRILSANTFQFTVGFLYTDETTGKKMFDVETARNSYQWEVK